MGGNPYRFFFFILYIDFEILLFLVLNFFSSRHDLLGFVRIVFDQFIPF